MLNTTQKVSVKFYYNQFPLREIQVVNGKQWSSKKIKCTYAVSYIPTIISRYLERIDTIGLQLLCLRETSSIGCKSASDRGVKSDALLTV